MLPDLLHRSSETRGDEVLYRFANGLAIKTEVFSKADTLRILPIGSPQCALMNHLLNFPDVVRGKRVFEPFAGSGVLGFAALTVGAEHALLLDVNPRTLDFQRTNAALNRFAPTRFTSILGDIADFVPEKKCDLLLANSPFVPTPEGIDGTITSNGGPDGNRFVGILLDRLEDFLEPDGRALIYVFQLVSDAAPLVVDLLDSIATFRSVEVTPSQQQQIPFDSFVSAYSQLFPDAAAKVEHWRAALVRRHGDGLGLCHYVVDIGPRTGAPGPCVIRDDFAEKFGEDFLVPAADTSELAIGRVFENFVPDTAANRKSEP